MIPIFYYLSMNFYNIDFACYFYQLNTINFTLYAIKLFKKNYVTDIFIHVES